MTEEIFYCECPRCSVHNKKTQDLAYNLKALRNSEFVFSEKFTPVMFFEVLKSVVAELNSEYRGREIKVEMMRHIDTISYYSAWVTEKTFAKQYQKIREKF